MTNRRRIGYHSGQPKRPTDLAYFHQFGTDYEEFENGPVNYPIAIIELDNGIINIVYASDIKF